MNRSRHIHLVSLGCPKNLIDSEVMVGILSEAGFHMTDHPEAAQVIIVNTCAFILPAKEESIEEILRFAAWKKEGVCRHLVVTGCLPQRYGDSLGKALPEVDLFLGTAEVPHIDGHLQMLEAASSSVPRVIAGRPTFLMDAGLPRRISTPRHVAYLKIAEGCSNCCSYCVIPSIRGRFRSRPMDDILLEAESLARRGVREIIITAQDTTAYGKDLTGKGASLSRLLNELSAIRTLRWIRLLYAYPTGITEELLRTVASEEKVCRYIDMPVQHIDNGILKAMNRRGTGTHIRKIMKTIRSTVPDAALRTSIIVGFPGETKSVFNGLLDFVREARFDHLGVFTYSKEEGTPAALLPSRISGKERELRREALMEEQAVISYEVNCTLLGSVQEVLVEGRSDNEAFPWVGRCRRQSPDIDGVTYIRGKDLSPGDFMTGRIIDAGTYDLFAETIEL